MQRSSLASRFAAVLLLLAASSSAFQLPAVSPQASLRRDRFASSFRHQSAFMAEPEEAKDRGRPKPTPNPNDSLYNTGADFQLDAVTITALLGAAVAFNFFVLANL